MEPIVPASALRRRTLISALPLIGTAAAALVPVVAARLQDTKVGTVTQTPQDEAKKDDWAVISMKNNRKKQIFAFDGS